MTENIISMNTLTIANNFTFKDQRLAKHTAQISAIYTNAVKYADTKNREISVILSTVKAEKSYEADGFKSVADYAEKIFGIKKQNAYALATAGDIYNDASASEKLKAFSPSKLAEVSTVDRATLEKDVADGKVTPTTSQKELREYSKAARSDSKDETPEVVETYTAKEIGTGYIAVSDILGHAYTLEEWDKIIPEKLQERAGAEYEAVKIPKAPAILPNGEIGKKATINRRVYISRKAAPVVVEFATYKPAVSMTLEKPKFSIDELRAMLAEAEAAQK